MKLVAGLHEKETMYGVEIYVGHIAGTVTEDEVRKQFSVVVHSSFPNRLIYSVVIADIPPKLR